jgi:hypothetical protein
MRAFYLFFSALIAAGFSYAADVIPLDSIQWAHITRADCASVAPAPCVPILKIVIYSRDSDLGYRVDVTYKPSNSPLPRRLILYGDQTQIGPIRGNIGFQGAILTYDPCSLDPEDITVLAIDVTPVTASGPTVRSTASARALK